MAIIALGSDGSMTTTIHKQYGSVKRIILDWTSSTNGTGGVTQDIRPISGQLRRVSFVPDSGATAPSNLYDVVLNDPDGIDVLAGLGANLASNANSSVCGGLACTDASGTTNYIPFAVEGVLTLSITNAGTSRGGQVVLYVEGMTGR